MAGQPGEERFSDARVVIKLVDINDNAPVFEEETYSVDILEDALPLTKIMKVQAIDVDTGVFGQVRYFITGEGSDTFDIDPVEGVISVSSRLTP